MARVLERCLEFRRVLKLPLQPEKFNSSLMTRFQQALTHTVRIYSNVVMLSRSLNGVN